MKSIILDEPELEFGGGGRHIDPRHGIANYGPVDVGTASAPSRIQIGIVAPEALADQIRTWLQRAREPLPAKVPRYPGQARLFPTFPGFDPDHSFRSVIAINERDIRPLQPSFVDQLTTMNTADATRAAVDAYMTEITWLAESGRCDVIICGRPPELDSSDNSATTITKRVHGPRPLRPDFHDQLKASALSVAPPLQLIRPESVDDPHRPSKGAEPRRVQDAATRAWNLHTALYLKAGGAPWRLIRSFSDEASCFVGISFYRSPDGSQIHTSVAQMFNERGEGVVVRGGPAAVSKDDRQVYLPEKDAHDLLVAALDAYRAEHGNTPARLVVHKTSRFVPEEIAGFDAAASEQRIGRLELVWVHERDSLRIFRPDEHPPLRGTLLIAAEDRLVLYTRGSIDFYETYPGMYVPAPLSLRPVRRTRSSETLATETLALTKLNWNDSQLDGRLPITLTAARKVGGILRHVPSGSTIARRYQHYM